MYSVNGNGFSSYSATLDSFDPMDGEASFPFHNNKWRIDSEGVKETIRSNFVSSDIQEKIDMLVEEYHSFISYIEDPMDLLI